MRHIPAKLDGSTSPFDLRLAADAIRGPSMQLLGHAERLAAAGVDSQPLHLIARHLLTLADDLHDAIGPMQRLALGFEQIAIGALARDIAAAVSAVLGGRRRWRIAPALDGLTLKADRRALHQILTRVLCNAARFTGDGDWIDIDTRLMADSIVISVQDEGHPWTASTGANTDRRGLGLGLLLSRRLMQAHGGALAVDSKPGIGTCVTLRFPRGLLIEG
jgi:two-component system cell cycle sensor histidine kinase PleC